MDKSRMTKEYAVVIEKANGNYAAYVPDLPGCTTTAPTVEEVEQSIQEAIAGHIAVLREYGEPVPEPSAQVRHVQVAA